MPCTAKGIELTNKYTLNRVLNYGQAIGLYEKFGFEYLKAPMGNSGHTDTDTWMIKNI